MRLLTALLACTVLVGGCASPSSDAPSTSDDDLTGATSDVFHVSDECQLRYESSFRLAELDLTDRDHPKYRIRQSIPGFDDTSHNNIEIRLKDGTVWKSPDNLSARSLSDDVIRAMRRGDWPLYTAAREAADARDPWEPLSVPKAFLDKGFELDADGNNHFQSWSVAFDTRFYLDDHCARDFYRPSYL